MKIKKTTDNDGRWGGQKMSCFAYLCRKIIWKTMNVSILKTALISLMLCLSLNSFSQSDVHVFAYPDGKVSSKGFLRDGKPDGYWQTFYENGNIKSEGNRKDFLLDGTWYFFSEEGDTTLVVNYSQGLKNGNRFTYLPDEIQQEPFVRDVKSGTGKRLDRKYRVLQLTTYEKGLEEGYSPVFDSTGLLKELLTYKKGYVVNRETLNRYDFDGRKNGYWKTFYENWQTHTEQYYRHGKRDGFYKEYDANGNLLTIKKYVNDVEQVLASEMKPLKMQHEYYSNGKVKREVSYRDGKKEGVWREFDENGNVKCSQTYKKGKLVDEGVVDIDGKRHGEYKQFYEDSTLKVEGAYVDGLKSGTWRYYFKNGNTEQIGEYVKDKPDGTWTWYYQDGKKLREENYYKGVFEGKYEEFDEEGNTLVSGSYFDGMKSGKWMEHIGGIRTEGEYRNDQKVGDWFSYYDNGKMAFRGKYVGDYPDGEHVYYYTNGKMRELQTYSGGIKNGPWKKYLKTGELFFEVTYEQGVEKKYDGDPIDEEDLIYE